MAEAVFCGAPYSVYVRAARIASLILKAETCLSALEALCHGRWLAGDALTLADLHAAPMFERGDGRLMPPLPQVT